MIGGEIRLTTVLTVAAFVGVGFLLPQRRWRALLALAAWLAGFEAFDMLAGLVAAVAGSRHPSAALGLLGSRWPLLLHDALIWYAPGLAAVVSAAVLGVRADLRLLALTAALWVGWWATGWHVNGHAGAFDPAAEAWNEAVKTAWALAYLAPLMRSLIRDPLTSTVP